MIRSKNNRSGFTLIEFTIAASLLGVVLTSAALVSRQSMQAIRVSQVQSDLEDRGRRGAERLAGMLENTNAIIPAPSPAPLDDFIFTTITGIDADGDTTSTPPGRIFRRYATGELDDGLDNNGNGLIDEGEVVYTRNSGEPNEISIVLFRGVPELLGGELPNGADDNGNGLVDEPGFSVLQEGDILVIRLSIGAHSLEGEDAVRTIETGVHIRN